MFFLLLLTLLLSFVLEGSILAVFCSFLYDILYVVGVWKVFKKMGEPGWKSLIPFYNDYILFKRCWSAKWYILYALATFAVYFFGALAFESTFSMLLIVLAIVIFAVDVKLNYSISVSFGHGFWFFLGLYFFRPIFMMILGFNNDTYVKTK